jgi:hypothetical protein
LRFTTAGAHQRHPTASQEENTLNINRRTIDRGLIAAGAIIAIVFMSAGGLLAWGHSFANNQVHNQLAREQIFFPAKGTPALDAKEFPGLQQYAGKQVTTGAEAKAYADQFIWKHMMTASGGQTYAQVSTRAQANPTDTKLTALKTTLFQGDMLRASLLSAYGFSQFGAIAYWGMIAAFGGSALMAVLVLLGLVHDRRAKTYLATTETTGPVVAARAA